ncbi:MAG: molybdopterin molybdotransferase MoeA [Rhizobiales bacterium]|nr:molybdopterin molybdotransferase MoeA [Hyphomicrobiales bacterium]
MITSLATPVGGVETLPVRQALGRVLAGDATTRTALPRFDHAAVDGYALCHADVGREAPFDVRLAAGVAAGGPARRALAAGSALRVFTVEERCRLAGTSVTVTVPVPAGANIRRRGEDVPEGARIVEAGTVLDARHAAILTAAGVTTVAVRRRVRVAVLSNGNELVDSSVAPRECQIPDANRPMLLALLEAACVDAIDHGCHPDDPKVLARVFERAASEADVVISSGGVAGSDADHVARAVAAAGGRMRRFRLALKPGKPILAGSIGDTPVLGWPGNPVAAMVNFLVFGRPLVNGIAGSSMMRPVGQAAVAGEPFSHATGRTEFLPVKVTDRLPDGRPRLLRLGCGGSARLRPLVLADGFAELEAASADLEAESTVRFHPFTTAFTP